MYDAVLVVPGIMGSELVDTSTGKVVWGIDLATVARGRVLRSHSRLKVKDEDLAGRGPIQAKRLLRTAGFLSILGGLEPYTDLLDRLQSVVPDSRAVAECPYDWRLSIATSAGALMRKAAQHLKTWRKVVEAERLPADPKEIRLVIVAHSMGGLVARFAIEQMGLHTEMRRLVTLGTPFYGSVKSLKVLDTGEGAPPLASAVAARELAVTCPGVYDLLPRTECVIGAGGVPRLLFASDLSSIGASATLAEESEKRWSKLRIDNPQHQIPVSVMVGSAQATAISIGLSDSRLLSSDLGYSNDGDGTVAESSALPPGIEASFLPQQHEALAKSGEGLLFAAKKMLGLGVGQRLGGGDAVGLDVPDTLLVGEVSARVTGVESAGDVDVSSAGLGGGTPRRWRPQVRDGNLHFKSVLDPGYHRISVSQGGTPVTKIISVVYP